MEQTILNGKKYFIMERTNETEMETVAVGMLEQNEIKYLLPFRMVRHDREEYLRYDAQQGIPLEQWMKEVHSKKEVLELLDSLISAQDELSGYLLEADHLCTENEFIVVNNNRCRMAYIPVADYDKGNILQAVQSILNGVNYALDEDYTYIFDLMNAFSRRDITTCDELRKWIRILERGEKPQAQLNKVENRQDRAEYDMASLSPESVEKPNDVEKASRKRMFFGLKRKEEKQETPEPFAAEKIEEEKMTPPQFEKHYNELEDTGSTVFLQEEKQGYLVWKNQGREYPIEHESYVIGSSAQSADICLENNGAVSRKHARISRSADTYYLEDLGSMNGTYVNGEKLREGERRQLEDRMRIKLANEDFVFEMRRR